MISASHPIQSFFERTPGSLPLWNVECLKATIRRLRNAWVQGRVSCTVRAPQWRPAARGRLLQAPPYFVAL